MTNTSNRGRRAARYARAGMIGIVTLACGEAPDQVPQAANETPAAKADALTICPWGSANLVGSNFGFDTVGATAWTLETGVVGASSPGPSAAADWTVYMNVLGDIKTEHVPSVPGASGGAIRVATTSPDGGIVRVYIAHHTGPSRVFARARVKVVRGTVGLFVGDGGRGTLVAESTVLDDWEMLSGTNAISPANEVTVYATSPGGAEFYVDEVSVQAKECGFSSTEDWAFLWAHATTGVFTPTWLYSASSNGLPATVDWSGGTGLAEVTLPGIGSEVGGNVQVNAYGQGNERCKITDWKEYGSDVHAFVSCTWPNGTPTSTPFVLAYVRKKSPSADPGGYVFADEPAIDGYVPNPLRQWNSSGNLNVVSRSGTGKYEVDFRGISVGTGTALVTAAGGDSSHCTIGKQTLSRVYVNCFDSSGTPTDARFSLNFSSAWPILATSFAYAHADGLTGPAYVPASQRNVLDLFGTSLPALDAGRNSTGSYFVNVPGQPAYRSNVLVVASEAMTGSYCKPAYWFTVGRGPHIEVRCYSWFGQPIDSVYNAAYTTF